MESERSIDVVLTTYKRPEILLHQLNAIKAQSVKPDKVYLYQDGIDSFYKISIDGELLKEFDDYYIAEKNGGVWKRFEYACNISTSAYVCIFDDDTIPGCRWLENCLESMKKEKAVYGTNGVLIKDYNNYPSVHSMLNVGWKNPNEDSTEVDFVGHSWFIDRMWLEDMLDTGLKERYKYVGEDMYLSYICRKKGIRTIVPPHPYSSPDLWGCIPRYGNQYGINNLAISADSKNHSLMNRVIRELHDDGWNFIIDTDKEYIDMIEKEFMEEHQNVKKAIESDLSEIMNTDKSIYLYGAGLYGGYFYDYLSHAGKKIEGFVVTQNNTGFNSGIEHVPTVNINEFLNINQNPVIVILALNEFYHEEIRGLLDKDKIISIFPKKDRGYMYKDLIDYIKTSYSVTGK